MKKKTVPAITEVTPKEPKSHAKRFSTLTAVRAKFSADESAVWNCENAITTDFIRFGALVYAYSSDVMDA